MKLDECCVRRAESKPDAKGQREKVRDYTETIYGAKSWSRPRRVVARIETRSGSMSREAPAGLEVTEKGADVRYVVTNLPYGDAEWLYDRIYCARGQAENLIKRLKSFRGAQPPRKLRWTNAGMFGVCGMLWRFRSARAVSRLMVAPQQLPRVGHYHGAAMGYAIFCATDWVV